MSQILAFGSRFWTKIVTNITRLFFYVEWAPAGAPGAPGAQTPWSGALRDKKFIIVFPYKMPCTCAIGEFEAFGAPLGPSGPFWDPGALGAPRASGALTPWPIPHKKKVEQFCASEKFLLNFEKKHSSLEIRKKCLSLEPNI